MTAVVEEDMSLERGPPGFEIVVVVDADKGQSLGPDIVDRVVVATAGSNEVLRGGVCEMVNSKGSLAYRDKGQAYRDKGQENTVLGEEKKQRISTMNHFQPLQDANGGPTNRRGRGRVRSEEGRNKQRARSSTQKRGGLAFVPTLVLSKRIEYEAIRRSEIKRKNGKGSETLSLSNQSKQLKEEKARQLQKSQEIDNIQVTTRVVGEISNSDRTPIIEFGREENEVESREVVGRENVQRGEASDVLRSLTRCQTEEDVEHWWRLMVVPTANNMGLSYQFGFEALKALLKNLCKMKVLGSGETNNVQGGAMQELGRLLDGGATIVNNDE
ncbi:hypothetical protein FRX31_024565 [Thalictrum thalictroides]|uniref:Uncharacterized protein n=1 Tax=Thalictrum thalictroides TaxID=46969 RepID=A0A7J6VNS5_THATH|nr:hypothetical protein FRX31_024565 [Thalictrum thalictroides]